MCACLCVRARVCVSSIVSVWWLATESRWQARILNTPVSTGEVNTQRHAAAHNYEPVQGKEAKKKTKKKKKKKKTKQSIRWIKTKQYSMQQFMDTFKCSVW